MNYLLDTGICIYIMKKHPVVVEKLATVEAEEVAVSAITVSELSYGVNKSMNKRVNQQILNDFLKPITLIEYDLLAAASYGAIRASLEKRGQVIGPLDMLIAAQTLSRDLTLATNNEREFRRVEGLKIENWSK